MRLLVAGLTGQLGAGLRALAADDHDLRLVAVRRPGSPRALGPGEADEVVAGDVRRPMWGLDPAALTGVDAVVNLAAETNWVASSRELYAVNALGAAHGHQLTRELAGRGGRVIPYVHAGSVYVAGGAVGEIAERPVPPAGDRTAYERSKWLAEQRLLSAAADPGGPAPVLIARMPALVGDSRTGRTLRRNSLYLLADRWSDLPGNVLPAMRDARVDALPRDVAAGTLLRLVRAVVRRPAVRAGHLPRRPGRDRAQPARAAGGGPDRRGAAAPRRAAPGDRRRAGAAVELAQRRAGAAPRPVGAQRPDRAALHRPGPGVQPAGAGRPARRGPARGGRGRAGPPHLRRRAQPAGRPGRQRIDGEVPRMTVLVAGGSGYLGAEVCAALEAAGEQVVAIVPDRGGAGRQGTRRGTCPGTASVSPSATGRCCWPRPPTWSARSAASTGAPARTTR
ncbi:conserved hypothetical protein [Micromonospora sp. ATCC 39149]|nr:conserved hypothetical protein [Micromonospora sp. ATCC 39149]